MQPQPLPIEWIEDILQAFQGKGAAGVLCDILVPHVLRGDAGVAVGMKLLGVVEGDDAASTLGGMSAEERRLFLRAVLVIENHLDAVTVPPG